MDIKFENTLVPVHSRRLAIIATEEKLIEIKKKFGIIGYFRDAYNPFNLKFALDFYKTLFKGENPVKKYFDFPWKAYELNNAKSLFDFPPQHPIDGTIYGCCDMEPDLYVPVASFHRYMYDLKMAAFSEMCASLGAKSCNVIFAEENGEKKSVTVDPPSIPTQAGNVGAKIKTEYSSSSKENANLFFSFPKNKKPVTKFKSNWLNGEPSWVALQKIRLENDVEKYTAEFHYEDEMGINFILAAKINEVKIEIGGSFEEMVKRKYVYEVTFWPK